MNAINKMPNKGLIVALAGLGMNLCMGVIYTWGIYKESILTSIRTQDGYFNWNPADLNNPYAICCLAHAISDILAGWIHDEFGPKLTAFIGGILTGLGLIVCALSFSLIAWVIGFGVLTGTGLGFAFTAATPPAIKWYPAAKTGLIAGIVVAGFGLAPAYMAPLSEFLISRVGLNNSMMIFGITSGSMICVLAMFLVNPPVGYNPDDIHLVDSSKSDNITVSSIKNINYVQDYSPIEMLKTSSFYKLWIMFGISAGAGLMIIGNAADIAKDSLGDMAWIGVTLIAVGNASGRVVAGVISDNIGRTRTMFIVMFFQAVLMFTLLLFSSSNIAFIVTVATLVGFNFGTNLSLFPSITKDYFGLKNFGLNYGILGTAFGVGGYILPWLSQVTVANTGSYDMAYLMAGCPLILSAGITFITTPPR